MENKIDWKKKYKELEKELKEYKFRHIETKRELIEKLGKILGIEKDKIGLKKLANDDLIKLIKICNKLKTSQKLDNGK